MKELSKFEAECIRLSHFYIEQAGFNLLHEDFNGALESIAQQRYNVNLLTSCVRQKQHPKRDCEVCNV